MTERCFNKLIHTPVKSGEQEQNICDTMKKFKIDPIHSSLNLESCFCILGTGTRVKTVIGSKIKVLATEPPILYQVTTKG